MKQHLLNTFRYNEKANMQLIEAIKTLDQKEEALKLMSHLISAQDKWFNRLSNEAEDSAFSWFGTIYAVNEIAFQWERSVKSWIAYIEKHTETALDNFITFTNISTGKKMKLKINDLVLQLNYHSIHHRAQINTLISKQGIKPPVTDYIFTVLQEA